MPLLTEYEHLDATELAELVRSKQLQPIELAEAAIDRIEALNPKLNAVVVRSMRLAAQLEQAQPWAARRPKI